MRSLHGTLLVLWRLVVRNGTPYHLWEALRYTSWELGAATTRKPNECGLNAEAMSAAQDGELNQQAHFRATPSAYQVINVQ